MGAWSCHCDSVLSLYLARPSHSLHPLESNTHPFLMVLYLFVCYYVLGPEDTSVCYRSMAASGIPFTVANHNAFTI